MVLLTDMFGGTPSNLAISMMDKAKVEVIAGVNLPMLIKLAELRQSRALADGGARRPGGGPQIHQRRVPAARRRASDGRGRRASASAPRPARTPRRTVTILNQRGLHARAAARFVKLAGDFDAEITVAKTGTSVSGRSIMGLMMLAAGPGSVDRAFGRRARRGRGARRARGADRRRLR